MPCECRLGDYIFFSLTLFLGVFDLFPRITNHARVEAK